MSGTDSNTATGMNNNTQSQFQNGNNTHLQNAGKKVGADYSKAEKIQVMDVRIDCSNSCNVQGCNVQGCNIQGCNVQGCTIGFNIGCNIGCNVRNIHGSEPSSQQLNRLL